MRVLLILSHVGRKKLRLKKDPFIPCLNIIEYKRDDIKPNNPTVMPFVLYVYLRLNELAIDLSKDPLKGPRRKPILLDNFASTEHRAHQASHQRRGVGVGLFADTVLTLYNHEFFAQITHTCNTTNVYIETQHGIQ